MHVETENPDLETLLQIVQQNNEKRVCQLLEFAQGRFVNNRLAQVDGLLEIKQEQDKKHTEFLSKLREHKRSFT